MFFVTTSNFGEAQPPLIEKWGGSSPPCRPRFSASVYAFLCVFVLVEALTNNFKTLIHTYKIQVMNTVTHFAGGDEEESEDEESETL